MIIEWMWKWWKIRQILDFQLIKNDAEEWKKVISISDYAEFEIWVDFSFWSIKLLENKMVWCGSFFSKPKSVQMLLLCQRICFCDLSGKFRVILNAEIWQLWNSQFEYVWYRGHCFTAHRPQWTRKPKKVQKFRITDGM